MVAPGARLGTGAVNKRLATWQVDMATFHAMECHGYWDLFFDVAQQIPVKSVKSINSIKQLHSTLAQHGCHMLPSKVRTCHQLPRAQYLLMAASWQRIRTCHIFSLLVGNHLKICRTLKHLKTIRKHQETQFQLKTLMDSIDSIDVMMFVSSEYVFLYLLNMFSSLQDFRI